MTTTYQAFVTDGSGTGRLEERSRDQLPDQDVTIQVHYSSINYKDGLALQEKSKVASSYPMVPGIDMAGEVVQDRSGTFQAGDLVIATSYDIGTAQDGGFAELACVPAEWVLPLPEGLTLEEAMTAGTAGLTAAMGIIKLERQGMTPEQGPVLVTGATGGVGSMACAMLAGKGYHVTASTGKEHEHAYLRGLGVTDIIDRRELDPDKDRPLYAEQWAYAVDATGGRPLAVVLASLKRGGAAAAAGLTAGTDLPVTVMPFILRGVDLLGIDSGYGGMDLRKEAWRRIGADLKPQSMKEILTIITPDELEEKLQTILNGEAKGRMVVRMK
ncbi:acryloyl-CoA reductase [Alkalicoccus chagannorensis]|uniref:acrylyl-CoA reductase family protein n=1 Tax=Alkalicoccus chagannorensis TaxID=427072 RepID=UPI000558498B|nr:acryloyl-CoA reductase [Alkalicoccus chagannorensis]